MSNLGLHSVYALFNSDAGYQCERGFLPDADESALYEKSGTPLLSLESQSPIKDFDIIAFTASFEKDYINIAAILEAIGIPVFADERDDSHPLIIAGGCGVSLNPEPIAELIDIFLLGEGEASLPVFMEVFAACVSSEDNRQEQFRKILKVPGAYVPSFYNFEYDGDKVVSIKADNGAPEIVLKARLDDLDSAPLPQSIITTPDTSFSNTFLIEAERGCPRGCRFCSAGFIYLPPRWRSLDVLKNAIKKGLERTGKVGLVGAAISEHPGLKEMLRCAEGDNAEITISSLRADVVDAEMLELLKDVGYKTITIAPEAGTERLRQVINKDMSDECLVECARLAGDAGFRRMKLYYMVGLPTETEDDVRAIAELTIRIKDALKHGSVALSINPFIPKPVTPFQWYGYAGVTEVEKKYKVIKKMLVQVKGVSVKTESAKEAYLQAWLARADRRAGRVIVEAARHGLKRAVRDVADARESVERTRAKDEVLPWDVVDHSLKKDYLWKEYQAALKCKVTEPCVMGECFRCGVC
jgi:radical SAM superfamily enzyme YgiQ (UPF0313 family)